jgi:proteic killer suppression protein
MIKSFRHAGIKRFFETGSKAGIQPKHAKRLRLQLSRLDAATVPADMDLPGWRFHSLKGQLTGHFAVWVDENWRVTFGFEAETPFWWITRTITDEGRYGTDA